MSFPRIVLVSLSVMIAGAGTAAADWPLEPTEPARTARIGSRDLIWTNTYAIVRDRISGNIEVLAEDSVTYYVHSDGSAGGSITDFRMASVVGPFVSFSVYSEGNRGRGISRRWVKHIGSRYPDAGDIRGLFDEADIIEVLERDFGLELSQEDYEPGALIRILGTSESLPCPLRNGLIDQWAVLEIGDETATVSVVGDQCPIGSNQSTIELPIPETKRFFFEDARRRRNAQQDQGASTPPWTIRPSLYLRDLPPPWTPPQMPPETRFQEADVVYEGETARVRWNNRRFEIFDGDGTEGRWIRRFGSSYSATDYGWSRDTFTTADREVVSLIGPFMTYREVERTSDSERSGLTVQFKTENFKKIRSGQIPITTLFDELEVVNALVQSAVVAPHIGDIAPASIRQMAVRGDTCGIFRHLMTSWAILDFKDDRARVRITLPATEEICGDYHETFDVLVPVKPEWKEYVQAAKNNGLLGVHGAAAKANLVQPLAR